MNCEEVSRDSDLGIINEINNQAIGESVLKLLSEYFEVDKPQEVNSVKSLARFILGALATDSSGMSQDEIFILEKERLSIGIFHPDSTNFYADYPEVLNTRFRFYSALSRIQCMIPMLQSG